MARPESETRRIRPFGKLVWLTLAGTAACVMLSLALNYLLLFFDALTPFGRSVATAIAVPVIIGVPVFAFIGLQSRKLRHYQQELSRLATYDGLTACMNGNVFSSLVDRRKPRSPEESEERGAFLVVRAEQIRSINARYGHSWGEEALRIIARTIRSSVRAGDIVGRVGATDFAVFLPGATEENAQEVGERIRKAVAAAYFGPESDRNVLQVSIGGVMFEEPTRFDDLFRAAETRLSAEGFKERLELSHMSVTLSQSGRPPVVH